MQNNKLTLFTSTDGDVTINVQLNNNTVWLSLNQLSQLFDRDKSVISRHLKNIFTDEELDKKAVVANFATTASDSKTYQIEYFNLDAILSVGYRVNSKQATKFRQWANSILTDYLLKGYALNNNILDKTHNEYQNLLGLLNNTLINNQLITEQGQNIISLINEYTVTWSSLLQYDEDKLAIPNNTHKTSNSLSHGTTVQVIAEFKSSLINIGETTPLFGNERNDQLQSIRIQKHRVEGN